MRPWKLWANLVGCVGKRIGILPNKNFRNLFHLKVVCRWNFCDIWDWRSSWNFCFVLWSTTLNLLATSLWCYGTKRCSHLPQKQFVIPFIKARYTSITKPRKRQIQACKYKDMKDTYLQSNTAYRKSCINETLGQGSTTHYLNNSRSQSCKWPRYWWVNIQIHYMGLLASARRHVRNIWSKHHSLLLPHLILIVRNQNVWFSISSWGSWSNHNLTATRDCNSLQTKKYGCTSATYRKDFFFFAALQHINHLLIISRILAITDRNFSWAGSRKGPSPTSNKLRARWSSLFGSAT